MSVYMVSSLINSFAGSFFFHFAFIFSFPESPSCKLGPSPNIVKTLTKCRWQLFRRATTSQRRVGRSGLAPPSTTPTRPRLSRARIGVVPPARPVPTWGNQATSPLLLTVRTIYLQSKHALSNFVLSSIISSCKHSFIIHKMFIVSKSYILDTINLNHYGS